MTAVHRSPFLSFKSVTNNGASLFMRIKFFQFHSKKSEINAIRLIRMIRVVIGQGLWRILTMVFVVLVTIHRYVCPVRAQRDSSYRLKLKFFGFSILACEPSMHCSTKPVQSSKSTNPSAQRMCDYKRTRICTVSRSYSPRSILSCLYPRKELITCRW